MVASRNIMVTVGNRGKKLLRTLTIIIYEVKLGLAWLLDMTRAEKEEFVIRLYKENKSIREIAKLMHMSFRDIGANMVLYKYISISFFLSLLIASFK